MLAALRGAYEPLERVFQLPHWPEVVTAPVCAGNGIPQGCPVAPALMGLIVGLWIRVIASRVPAVEIRACG